jgi:hypothetical protein
LGQVDYHLGMHPLFAAVKLVKRIFQKPYIIGGLALFAGYCVNNIRRPARNVSRDFIRFCRKEQMQRLAGPFLKILRLPGRDSGR